MDQEEKGTLGEQLSIRVMFPRFCVTTENNRIRWYPTKWSTFNLLLAS